MATFIPSIPQFMCYLIFSDLLICFISFLYVIMKFTFLQLSCMYHLFKLMHISLDCLFLIIKTFLSIFAKLLNIIQIR